MSTSAKKLEYLPGLDGIRALAALLVISTHWPGNMLSLKFGWMGVNIFFVLSGFLITRILINEKDRPFKLYLAIFFRKRALRILPVYYLFFLITITLVLAYYWLTPPLSHNETILSAVDSIKYDLASYLSFTFNIKLNLAYFFHWLISSNNFLGHVWSLAVEEQFYLLFPFVVYFTNTKTLKKILIAIVCICPLLRLWGAVVAVHLVKDTFWLGETFYTNTLCQADALAAGALLAVCPVKIKFPYLNLVLIAITWLFVGLICFYFLRKSGYFLVAGKSLGYDYPAFWFTESTPYFLINIRAFYQYSLVNLLAVMLIAPGTIKKPLFPFILQSKPARYIGKISYGMYLYHAPILTFLLISRPFISRRFTLPTGPLAEISIFLIYLAIVISVAHLSYQYFEIKIMNRYRLKTHYA